MRKWFNFYQGRSKVRILNSECLNFQDSVNSGIARTKNRPLSYLCFLSINMIRVFALPFGDVHGCVGLFY